MISAGDKVLYNAVTGDVISVQDSEGAAHVLKVADTWPNGVRAEALDGDWDTHLTYHKLRERGAAYVRVREKSKAPCMSFGGLI